MQYNPVTGEEIEVDVPFDGEEQTHAEEEEGAGDDVGDEEDSETEETEDEVDEDDEDEEDENV